MMGQEEPRRSGPLGPLAALRKIIPIEADQIGEEDTIPEEEMVVTITRTGYIKRVSPETYRVQNRGGRGVIALRWPAHRLPSRVASGSI